MKKRPYILEITFKPLDNRTHTKIVKSDDCKILKKKQKKNRKKNDREEKNLGSDHHRLSKNMMLICF